VANLSRLLDKGQYDPVLFVPESLMDGLEVASDLKSAAKRLILGIRWSQVPMRKPNIS
jgi:hypothetical protein